MTTNKITNPYILPYQGGTYKIFGRMSVVEDNDGTETTYKNYEDPLILNPTYLWSFTGTAPSWCSIDNDTANAINVTVSEYSDAETGYRSATLNLKGGAYGLSKDATLEIKQEGKLNKIIKHKWNTTDEPTGDDVVKSTGIHVFGAKATTLLNGSEVDVSQQIKWTISLNPGVIKKGKNFSYKFDELGITGKVRATHPLDDNKFVEWNFHITEISVIGVEYIVFEYSWIEQGNDTTHVHNGSDLDTGSIITSGVEDSYKNKMVYTAADGGSGRKFLGPESKPYVKNVFDDTGADKTGQRCNESVCFYIKNIVDDGIMTGNDMTIESYASYYNAEETVLYSNMMCDIKITMYSGGTMQEVEGSSVLTNTLGDEAELLSISYTGCPIYTTKKFTTTYVSESSFSKNFSYILSVNYNKSSKTMTLKTNEQTNELIYYNELKGYETRFAMCYGTFLSGNHYYYSKIGDKIHTLYSPSLTNFEIDFGSFKKIFRYQFSEDDVIDLYNNHPGLELTGTITQEWASNGKKNTPVATTATTSFPVSTREIQKYTINIWDEDGTLLTREINTYLTSISNCYVFTPKRNNEIIIYYQILYDGEYYDTDFTVKNNGITFDVEKSVVDSSTKKYKLKLSNFVQTLGSVGQKVYFVFEIPLKERDGFTSNPKVYLRHYKFDIDVEDYQRAKLIYTDSNSYTYTATQLADENYEVKINFTAKRDDGVLTYANVDNFKIVPHTSDGYNTLDYEITNRQDLGNGKYELTILINQKYKTLYYSTPSRNKPFFIASEQYLDADNVFVAASYSESYIINL